ncbi:hypothetical protein N0V88_005247 [Collariella sp. IMI 366227]|nr:hypothetical protein N0V88_005247 [Collariella sp. IMI 366227]
MAKKVKSRIINVRLLSMAMTGYFYTFTRPRTALPMSMIKYDPISGQRLDSVGVTTWRNGGKAMPDYLRTYAPI